ncbi:molybdopterin molybdotransferase MoeA [Altererythrobacter sp. SALINAS58]|uniref:molybdopterin molybdotransferase MoeA n=1 Tax=Alteripontixanthobacter muriae TaxID=2705546 RepID=UPI001576E33C|nr:molybdopterin molybdotransferase MoeA [Alteripontixanthobacter muriae]NTZ41619.1 molybdopterin molybdotransferase MoeA [Alteripontixanthobacter muriae]
MTLLPLQDAQSRLLDLVAPLPASEKPIFECLGHYLAADILARRSQPAIDISAMDGFAIQGSGPWEVVGASRAGAPFAGTLARGEAIRISTGAALPKGPDRILIKEDAELNGENLSVLRDAPAQGRHVRVAGFDFAAGDVVLRAGVAITPAAIALAAMAGHSRLPVRRPPVIAILESGNELSSDPESCGPHQIPSSNGLMLAALFAQYPCEIRRIGPVRDDLGSLSQALDEADGCDLLVTSGGASVGDYDLIGPALQAWGATTEFWRVAIKPGKPLMAATRDECVIIGLPGNPVSSFVTAFLFALPVIRAMLGSASPLPRAVMLETASGLPATGSRREFIRARLNADRVEPLTEQDSSALLSLSQADGLIERPEGCEELEAGARVPFYPVKNGAIA